MKTISDFRASRTLSVDIDADLGYLAFGVVMPGYIYDGCYISITSEGKFLVEVCNEDRLFATLEEAEQYLWDEWASTEW